MYLQKVDPSCASWNKEHHNWEYVQTVQEAGSDFC